MSAPGRQHLTVVVNQSRVIRLGSRAARVSVANPEIADILVLDPQQVYVVGKRIGTTNVVLWDARDRVRDNLLLEVTPDLDLLKTRLHEVMPGEKVEVRSAQGTIVVSGVASSPERAQAAMDLAKSFAGTEGGSPPLNMVQVGGSQQVMLEVKVAEVSRDFGKSINGLVNANYMRADGLRFGTVGSGAALTGSASTGNTFNQDGRNVIGNLTNIATTGNYTDAAAIGRGFFSQFASGNFLFTAALEAAKTSGQAKVLAEPNLTTLSGQEAKFLAGGEYPYQVTQSSGTAGPVYTYEFKPYGVGLTFIPVVLGSGVINLKVNVTVSELDWSVVTATNRQPGLKTRQANVTVELKTGESISIAGLISEQMRQNVSKFPGLGDIPILGALFRSQEFSKNQSELIIFVTPRLARGIDPSQVKLPTAPFVAPTDVEFYLLGRTQGRNDPGSAPSGSMGPDRSGSEGAYGHDL